MAPGDFFDFVPLEPARLRVASLLDGVLAMVCVVVMGAWVAGSPVLYTPAAPVMSPLTALSLLLMLAVRQARLRLETWPMVLSLAMTGLVLGGNLSSIVMLSTMPAELWASFPDLVLTSVTTSVGLVCFCVYDLVVALRRTPEQGFILDDLLLHVALVPGALSLLGYLLGNPTYLSIHADPRVGISPLEIGCMALYVSAAAISNPQLFLWPFLAASWTNRAVFAVLFANQFVAPMAIAWLLSTRGAEGPGLELFVMLAGAVTTMAFLLLQARVIRRRAPGVAATT